MNRTNMILSGLLVFQIVLFGLLYAFCGEQGAKRRAPVLLLQGLDREALQRIVLQDADDRTITLARKDGGWLLPDKSDYPVDAEKIKRTLSALLGLESGYIVSTGTDHHVDLEVAADKYRRKVTLQAGDDQRVLLLGSTGTDGFTRVRLEQEPVVYAVDDLKVWELGTRVDDWAKREYLKVDSDRLASLEIQRERTQIRLERAGPEEWRLDGRPLDKSKADPLVDDATKIELSDVLGKSADAAVLDKVKKGKDPVKVTLSLAKESLTVPPEPDSADAPEVPAPAPLGAGAASDENKPEEAEQPEAKAPEITERKVLYFASHPDKDSVVFLYLEGASHAVQVERWRVRELLEVDPAKLREKDKSP